MALEFKKPKPWPTIDVHPPSLDRAQPIDLARAFAQLAAKFGDVCLAYNAQGRELVEGLGEVQAAILLLEKRIALVERRPTNGVTALPPPREKLPSMQELEEVAERLESSARDLEEVAEEIKTNPGVQSHGVVSTLTAEHVKLAVAESEKKQLEGTVTRWWQFGFALLGLVTMVLGGVLVWALTTRH